MYLVDQVHPRLVTGEMDGPTTPTMSATTPPVWTDAAAVVNVVAQVKSAAVAHAVSHVAAAAEPVHVADLVEPSTVGQVALANVED